MENNQHCSGGISWIYKKILNRPASFDYCCEEHDLAYEEGGWFWDKVKADHRFYHCLRDAKRPYKAYIFFTAVLLFGSYAWYKCRIKDLFK